MRRTTIVSEEQSKRGITLLRVVPLKVFAMAISGLFSEEAGCSVAEGVDMITTVAVAEAAVMG